MIIDKEFERMFRQEFKGLSENVLFQNEIGEYEVFGKYRIIPEAVGYRVYCSATEVGNFSNTKTALSWCIADKFTYYNLARDILTLDNKLNSLISDISVRANLADRSKTPLFRETIETKLETKIIRKKQVEQDLCFLQPSRSSRPSCGGERRRCPCGRTGVLWLGY